MYSNNNEQCILLSCNTTLAVNNLLLYSYLTMAYIIIMLFALHNLLAGWLGETTLPSILYSPFASVLRNVYISWPSDEPRQPQAYVINS